MRGGFLVAPGLQQQVAKLAARLDVVGEPGDHLGELAASQVDEAEAPEEAALCETFLPRNPRRPRP